MKLRGADTGGAMTALESTPDPGEGPPLHTHAAESELLYVLEGTFRFKLDGDIREAPPGTLVFVPPGTPHTWQNVGDSRARLLVVFTPAAEGMEGFFERFAEIPNESAQEAFPTLAGDSGMEVVGPPLAQSDPL
jgi:quercetin dioxygenase-like cupin family protein